MFDNIAITNIVSIEIVCYLQPYRPCTYKPSLPPIKFKYVSTFVFLWYSHSIKL